MTEIQAKAEMLIRKPVAEVFEAFTNPAFTTKFWFTKSSGKLEVGKQVQWEWEMYGAVAKVDVQTVEANKRIVIKWAEASDTVAWTFTARDDGTTFVSIVNAGFSGDDVVKQALDATEAFTLVLAGCKALLEHNIRLNLVADRFPQGVEQN